MLSAESAAGDFPEESVLMQQRIINRVEGDPHYDRYLQSFEPALQDAHSASAIIVAARQIARTVHAKAIVSFTCGGKQSTKLTNNARVVGCCFDSFFLVPYSAKLKQKQILSSFHHFLFLSSFSSYSCSRVSIFLSCGRYYRIKGQSISSRYSNLSD